MWRSLLGLGKLHSALALPLFGLDPRVGLPLARGKRQGKHSWLSLPFPHHLFSPSPFHMVATLDDGGQERGVEQLSRCQTTLSLSHLSLFTSNRLRAGGAGKEQRSVGEEGRSKRLRVVGSGSKLPVPPAFACTHEVAFPSVLAKGILLQLIKASLLSTTPGSVPAAPGSPHTAVPSRIGLGLPLSLGKTSTTLAPCLCSAFIFVSALASSGQPCFRPREVPPWPPSWSLISASPSPASASRLGHLPSRPSPASASHLGHLLPRPSPVSAISRVGIPARPSPISAISRFGHLASASVIWPRPSRLGHPVSASAFHS